MDPIDSSLQRLLDAAARVPEKPAGPPPFALEARVLAQLRMGKAEDELARLMLFFRRAAIGSALVMFLIVAWSWFHDRGKPMGAAGFAGYTLTIQLPP